MNFESENIFKSLEPGDVILVSNRWVKKLSDISSCVIRLANFTRKGFERRYWTHAAMYVGGGQIIEAFPAPMGIRRGDVGKVYLSDPDYKIKVLRLRNRSLAERSLAAKKCIELSANKSYDMIALVYFALTYVTPAYINFILEDKYLGRWLNTVDKYFCSELVADSYLSANVYCFDREPYQIMPAHFDNDLVFETVGELPMRNMGFILRLPDGFKIFGYGLCLLVWVLLVVILPIAILMALAVYLSERKPKPDSASSASKGTES